jgi:hypothetical protein
VQRGVTSYDLTIEWDEGRHRTDELPLEPERVTDALPEGLTSRSP